MNKYDLNTFKDFPFKFSKMFLDKLLFPCLLDHLSHLDGLLLWVNLDQIRYWESVGQGNKRKSCKCHDPTSRGYRFVVKNIVFHKNLVLYSWTCFRQTKCIVMMIKGLPNCKFYDPREKWFLWLGLTIYT